MIYPHQNETKPEFAARCLEYFQDEGRSADDIVIISELVFGNKDFAELDAEKRNALPAESFVFPKERRYPVHDKTHAVNALARSKGTADEEKVWAAVKKKYPDLPAFDHSEQLHWIEVFKTGTHTATNGDTQTYTEDDLDRIAGKYNDQTEHEAPLVIGHPSDNGPAFGWTVRLRREKDRLYAGIKQVAQEVIEANRKGHYRKVSISLYADGLLRHIGLLGAVPPAVKGLAPVAFASDKDFSEWVWTTEEWRVPLIGRILQRVRDFMIEKLGLEMADKLIPSMDIETLTDPLQVQRSPVQQDDNEFSEEGQHMTKEEKEAFEQLQRNFGELQKNFTTLQTNHTELQGKFNEQGKELKDIKDNSATAANNFAEAQKKANLANATALFDAHVEGLIREGKVKPGEKGGLMAEFSDLYQADLAVSYAEGQKSLVTRFKDRLAAREVTVRRTETKFSEGRARIVDPKQIPANFAEFEEISSSDLDIDVAANDYMKAHPGKTYEEAIDAVTH
jgi:hypothetical protein